MVEFCVFDVFIVNYMLVVILAKACQTACHFSLKTVVSIISTTVISVTNLTVVEMTERGGNDPLCFFYFRFI